MYSMVLMAAMLPSGDAAGFGKKNNGCNGGCHGTVVAAGCTGSAPAGCTGVVDSGCCGGGHKHGGGGFLGLRNRGNSCNGGGFLGGHKHKNSCNGGSGCTGGAYVAPAGCTGGGIVVPTPAPAAAPVAMPPKM